MSCKWFSQTRFFFFSLQSAEGYPAFKTSGDSFQISVHKMFTDPELYCHSGWAPSFQSLKKWGCSFLFQQLWKRKAHTQQFYFKMGNSPLLSLLQLTNEGKNLWKHCAIDKDWHSQRNGKCINILRYLQSHDWWVSSDFKSSYTHYKSNTPFTNNWADQHVSELCGSTCAVSIP